MKLRMFRAIVAEYTIGELVVVAYKRPLFQRARIVCGPYEGTVEEPHTDPAIKIAGHYPLSYRFIVGTEKLYVRVTTHLNEVMDKHDINFRCY